MTSVFDAFALSDFINATEQAAQDAWDEGALRQLSNRNIPTEVLGTHAWLLQADARLTWANWFVEGLIDRSEYINDESLKYANLYEAVKIELRLRHHLAPQDELNSVASQVADLAWTDITSRRKSSRGHINQEMREELWFSAEPEPRCYLCGYLFDGFARDKYLKRASTLRPGLPGLVDLVRPRGLQLRDLQIEIDHVRPVSAGGRGTIENLRLACGWCNSVKSNRYSLYASSSTSKLELRTKDLGRVVLPQPMWVLRMVATRGRCEASSGCDARLDSHELFLTPANTTGVLNPANAFVCCKKHDPWAASRLVGRGVLRPSRI